ncbi:MAG TPA: alpha/beta hydrolase family protein [Bacteroidales bacterium]|nr:alpha/beta hydrolase family protein [Bacteroidales bacterium]
MKTILVKSIVISFIISCSAIKIHSQEKEDLNVLQNQWLIHADASNSLYRHFADESFRLLEKRNYEIAGINTREQWVLRQATVKEKMWDILGRFPEKTPLNARVTGKIKKNGFTIENVMYETLPGFYMTASLFIPEKLKKPAPAILFCSGHTSGVYRVEFYQQPLLNLVKKGFIVLAIDPVGQGERLQYWDESNKKSLIGSSTLEHSYFTPQVYLLGKSSARYWVWDGIRSIDYLVSRKEVDPKRIGVHGLSGGGTQTAYISALDDRVTASAPAGYITSYRRLIESVGLQDGEQNFINELERGIDHADFIEVRAPKPTLVMATTRDFFSIQGVRETMEELRKVYALFEKQDNISLTEDDYGHGYTRKNREAMYAFFQKHLDNPGSAQEEEVEYVPAGELQKTATGQLISSTGGETVFSMNMRDAAPMLLAIDESRKNPDQFLAQVISKAGAISGFKAPDGRLSPVFTGRYPRNSYTIEKYFVKGDGDYVIPYLLFIPDSSNSKAIIYLNPAGKSADASPAGEMEKLARQGFTVLAPDLIGTGENSIVNLKGDAIISNTSYNLWFTSAVTGRSITGVQASDIIRLRMILSEREGLTSVQGVAKKELAPAMLYAAAFDKSISAVVLSECYSSYRSFVQSRFYYPGFVPSLVPGALTSYDLPDLAATLAPRKLVLAGVVNAYNMNSDPGIADDLQFIRNVYKLRNVSQNLIILPESPVSISDAIKNF